MSSRRVYWFGSAAARVWGRLGCMERPSLREYRCPPDDSKARPEPPQHARHHAKSGTVGRMLIRYAAEVLGLVGEREHGGSEVDVRGPRERVAEHIGELYPGAVRPASVAAKLRVRDARDRVCGAGDERDDQGRERNPNHLAKRNPHGTDAAAQAAIPISTQSTVVIRGSVS